MRHPRDFFLPQAIGAPEPLREIPVKPSRMIHFLDFSNEKMVAKAGAIAEKTDILLGNLEDAVPVDRKEAARAGLIRAAKENDFGQTSLWTRVNALESPWVLDDLTQLVAEIGDQLETIMVPKVEGAWDIHYVDRLLAQLEAKAELSRPILVHAILETPQGVVNLEEIANASPRMQGMSFGPADLAAGLGHLGKIGHPEVQSAIQDAIKRIRACGKPPGILATDEASTRRYMEWGTVFTAVGLDAMILKVESEKLRAKF